MFGKDRCAPRATLVRAAVPLSVAAALATTAVGHAQEAVAVEEQAPAVTVASVQDDLARKTAGSLRSTAWRTALVQAALTGRPVDLESTATRLGAPAELRSAVVDGNGKVLGAKGLPATTGDLLTLRLADPLMAEALKSGVEPLVATPADDDATTRVTAYDSAGRVHALSTSELPARPVLMVDIDVQKAMDAGTEQVNQTLALAGFAPQAPADMATEASVDTTKIVEVRVSNDHDPWFKGDSEIFTVVGGIAPVPGKPEEGKPIASVVKMPYLNTEKKTYYPNQILIYWNQYKFNAVDAIMWEDDGGTNYQALATELNKGLALLVKKYTAYAPVVEAIIKAMPSKWWTDDPDHVEQWYTIQKQTNGKINGASGNGWMKVVPFAVDEL